MDSRYLFESMQLTEASADIQELKRGSEEYQQHINDKEFCRWCTYYSPNERFRGVIGHCKIHNESTTTTSFCNEFKRGPQTWMSGEEVIDESLKLTENRWNYTLKCGKFLRQAINDDNAPRVLDLLYRAYRELLNAGLIDKDDYASYTEDFELYDPDEADFEDNIDYELDNLYDLCDNIGVWVSLD